MDEELIQPPNEGEKTEGNAQKAESQPTIAPVDIGEKGSPQNPKAPKADQKKRKRKPLSCFEICIIVLTSIGILVAAGTGIAIYWQDKIAASTLCELQNQYPKLAESADAAHISADALRPRLAIANLTPSPPVPNGFPMSGHKLKVSFQVQDYGPVGVEGAQICEFDDVREPSELQRLPYGNCQPSSAFNYGNPMIPPITGPSGPGVNGGGWEGSKILTDADIQGLKGPNPKLRAVFSIAALYKDAGGRPHHAESCILFTFQQRWGTWSMGAITWGSAPCPWETQND